MQFVAYGNSRVRYGTRLIQLEVLVILVPFFVILEANKKVRELELTRGQADKDRGEGMRRTICGVGTELGQGIKMAPISEFSATDIEALYVPSASDAESIAGGEFGVSGQFFGQYLRLRHADFSVRKGELSATVYPQASGIKFCTRVVFQIIS